MGTDEGIVVAGVGNNDIGFVERRDVGRLIDDFFELGNADASLGRDSYELGIGNGDLQVLMDLQVGLIANDDEGAAFASRVHVGNLRLCRLLVDEP